MKVSRPSRPYKMTARAEAAAQTARDILEATVELWREYSLDEITLQDIAKRADVSVQTVLRRFGSKEGVFEGCIDGDVARVRIERNRTPEGDIDQGLETLVTHYERDGDAVLRTLLLEHKLEAAARISAIGRREHRKWCIRVFAPYLPHKNAKHFNERVDAFVAATDLFLWKLLRRDLGRSPDETKRVIRTLLEGLVRLKSPVGGSPAAKE